MQKTGLGLGSMLFVLAQGVVAAPPGPDLKTVNCDQGKKIQDAVNAAVPNRDTTIVISGVCNENVQIARFLGPSLTLRGSDTGATVNNTLGEDASVFRIEDSRGVSIVNLTIGGGRGVRFRDCDRCNVLSNDITADSGITYINSDGEVGSNTITISGGVGIRITETSQVQLFSNTILNDGGNDLSVGIDLERASWAQIIPGPSEIGFTSNGIRVDSGAKLTISAPVHIHDVQNHGLFVWQDGSVYGGQVTIERGPIGVEARSGALVSLAFATIRDMTFRGIGVLENSHLEIQNSTISNTGSRGITVGTLSSAMIGGGTAVTGSTFNIACDASSKVTGTLNLQDGFTIKPGCTTDPNPGPVP